MTNDTDKFLSVVLKVSLTTTAIVVINSRYEILTRNSVSSYNHGFKNISSNIIGC